MRTTGIIVLVLCAVMVLFAVSPALASKIETKYTFGVLSMDTPNTGSTSYVAEKIEIARNHEGVSWDFGHPWGSGFSSFVTDFQLNIDSTSKNFLTGNGIDRFTTEYKTGTLNMVTTLKFEGFGALTYHGPEIVQAVPSYGQVTVSDGDTLIGIMFVGSDVGHGYLSAENVKVFETMAGVVVLAGPLTGLTVIYGAGCASD